MTTTGDSERDLRILRLLWAPPDPPRKGPRPRIGRGQVVAAGLELAASEGLAALSMRRIAAHLSVGVATIYTHVPGREELLALMFDALVGGSPLPAATGDWRRNVEAWAREDWELYRAAPWVAQLTASALPGPNLLAWYDAALATLAGTGLDSREMVAVVESVDGYVRGLAREVAAQPPPERAVAQARAVASFVDLDRLPALRAVALDGAIPGTGDHFEFGLQRLLDGVAALIAARAAGNLPPGGPPAAIYDSGPGAQRETRQERPPPGP
ncbi:MAG TPA: TetR/AcrR family transcriptional regulator [Phytomonospora sp.]